MFAAQGAISVDQIPEADRPRLLVFGESLGSFATESAFDDLDRTRRRSAGQRDLRQRATAEVGHPDGDAGHAEPGPMYSGDRQRLDERRI